MGKDTVSLNLMVSTEPEKEYKPIEFGLDLEIDAIKAIIHEKTGIQVANMCRVILFSDDPKRPDIFSMQWTRTLRDANAIDGMSFFVGCHPEHHESKDHEHVKSLRAKRCAK